MNIDLPNNYFTYTEEKSRNFAYVKNGELYIEGYVNFENLMYNLTYTIYGYERCYYCGELLTKNTRTLDHMFPRAYGGVSIPNNLRPCCRKCNSEQKGDMTYNQYQKWLKIPNEEDRHSFYLSVVASNRERMNRGEIIIPKSWVSQYDIKKLLKQVDFNCIKREDQKVKGWYNKTKAYCKPIVVTGNGWLYRGVHVLYHAKKHGVTRVPAVVMSNVIKA